ncbi:MULTISPECIES: YqkE family protein [unclassified Lysinibacillus]|uniref:YqkE family protein n=1 Tax=unclassified Lysinibacillus TaxID=2636778 RepID=UPI002010EF30|nr:MULTISPECIES: YqkE family protein [unclassified Lysinibacillus]MCL1698109.1 YqkE family protein [Lysinibacillus sp. BPa_S21]MCL1702738.1 YqkE family protein [Lysinibacillus sp. Bpr_S20]
MGKKRKQQQRVDNSVTSSLPKQEAVTLADQLGGDVLAKLKAAKQDLTVKEQAAEEERQAKLAFERKQREKNKSFEELLNEYGDKGSKF